MIDFNNNIYLGVASPDMERDLSNYYTKAQTRALVDAKQDIITGAATTITEDNLTANRAIISNASGKVAASNVTSTELGYLSGVTSGVQTQLNNKASTSLDNLTADGQMIIDSQNGTISNCVLEIPQNFKLEIVSGRPVVKAGSKVVLTGETYTETTIANDYTMNFQNFGESDGLIFYTISGQAYLPFSRIGSGNEQPSISGNTQGWFDTSTREMKFSTNGGSSWSNPVCSFALAAVHMNSSGQITNFLKDSNGCDMIFNGAGFVGHHAFIYPGVKGLRAQGLNADGSLKSDLNSSSSLIITELSQNAVNYTKCGMQYINGHREYHEADYASEVDTSKTYSFWYLRKENQTGYVSGGAFIYSNEVLFITYSTTGTTVTDFVIKQPVRTATVEMLNSALGDIETLLAAI